ncbi:MAG: TraR/DksA family transcriptional regulator [Candidimonas sp.]|nr:MAG: TraR/DksA family transcriptional regulator [Candidimonas sp.]
MGSSTQRHLAILRESLLRRLHELQAQVRTAEAAGRGGEGGDREVRDFKDEATQLADDVVDAVKVWRSIDELQQVQAALSRLDSGVYGNCVDCGEPIAFERLRVQPAAERCTVCQEAFEARVRAATDGRSPTGGGAARRP